MPSLTKEQVVLLTLLLLAASAIAHLGSLPVPVRVRRGAGAHQTQEIARGMNGAIKDMFKLSDMVAKAQQMEAAG
ncbi:hypothetical protein IscW_ISCW001524 [Ixodes scapularis]|uniref:Uncharacterized protein n=1 Tax=Ixodes scapularis TaxID=6945 RepID=B7P2P3_IXOSC|nr:hypothetical protein IscW_ISCW001524 [Ixodes scapularis]|eukprot:XP_002402673.1 hypothetical protein IscW_ISCW001524 [Ixodes scapularis]